MFTRTDPTAAALTDDDLAGIFQRLDYEPRDPSEIGEAFWYEAGALWMRRYGYHIPCTCGRDKGHRPHKARCQRERASRAAHYDLHLRLLTPNG